MIDRIIEVIDADNRSTRLISIGIMKWTFDNNLDFYPDVQFYVEP